MFIVIKFFVKDQSELDSPELDSPLSSSSELEGNKKNLSWMVIRHLGLTHRRGYHAFCAALYASFCLFFPPHLY